MNIIQLAAIQQANFTNLIKELNGYQTITTFWSDFTIADSLNADTKKSVSAIKDTYKNAFNGWKHDFKYLTELSLVLNHKIWYWFKKDVEIAKCYDELWRKHHDWCKSNLKGEAGDYYFQITD